jgi:hypothetical protein
MFLASASSGRQMWCGWQCGSLGPPPAASRASARSSVGALLRLSFLSLLISLVTARASGSRSHLRAQTGTCVRARAVKLRLWSYNKVDEHYNRDRVID